LAVGFLTRVAALGPLCTMLVAIITVHSGHGLLAKNGGFEYPLLLLLVSLFFALNGAGRLSLDAFLERRLSLSKREPRMREAPSQPL
jgi:putative oxidoreductase